MDKSYQFYTNNSLLGRERGGAFVIGVLLSRWLFSVFFLCGVGPLSCSHTNIYLFLQLFYILIYSKEYSGALQFQEKLMLEALEEIDQYCQHHSWLTEIHHFCRKWSDKALKELRGVPAFQIEVWWHKITIKLKTKIQSFSRINFMGHCHTLLFDP